MTSAIAEVVYPSMLKRMSAEELHAKFAGDPEEAARWIYAAAVHGHARAQILWGQMLLDGRNAPADPEAALRWFRIAAASGDADGLNMVGRCFERGWGVTPDRVEAMRWFQSAAAKGHAFAQFNLAQAMLAGGGRADLRGALTLLVRSARQGNEKAMNMIGRFRECGWLGPPRLESAFGWYRRAADRGCFRGSFHHGRLLLERGETDAAARRFVASVAAAPADFCADVAAILSARPEPELQQIGREASARAAANPRNEFAATRAPRRRGVSWRGLMRGLRSRRL